MSSASASGSRLPDKAWTRLGADGACSPSTSATPPQEPPPTPRLLLLPTLAKCQGEPPMEEVLLVRDEVANMAWGVEKTVPLATGVGRRGQRGRGADSQLSAELDHGGGAPPPPMAAPVRYQVMNTVPENWIPFIPVHVPNDNRQIQLQRAAMPRILVGDTIRAQKVQPHDYAAARGPGSDYRRRPTSSTKKKCRARERG